MASRSDIFFADHGSKYTPGGLGLFGSMGDDVSIWRHGALCSPGLWLISVSMSCAAMALLGVTQTSRHAVVDDFGTLQVIPA